MGEFRCKAKTIEGSFGPHRIRSGYPASTTLRRKFNIMEPKHKAGIRTTLRLKGANGYDQVERSR